MPAPLGFTHRRQNAPTVVNPPHQSVDMTLFLNIVKSRARRRRERRRRLRYVRQNGLSHKRSKLTQRAVQYRLAMKEGEGRPQDQGLSPVSSDQAEQPSVVARQPLPSLPPVVDDDSHSFDLEDQEGCMDSVRAEDIAKMPEEDRLNLRQWIVGKLRTATSDDRDSIRSKDSRRRDQKSHARDRGSSRRGTSPTSRSTHTTSSRTVKLVQNPVRSDDAPRSPSERHRRRRRFSPRPLATDSKRSTPRKRSNSHLDGSHRQQTAGSTSCKDVPPPDKKGRETPCPVVATSTEDQAKQEGVLSSHQRSTLRDKGARSAKEIPVGDIKVDANRFHPLPVPQDTRLGSLLGYEEASCIAQMVVTQAKILQDDIKALGERAMRSRTVGHTGEASGRPVPPGDTRNVYLFSQISDRAQKLHSLVGLIVEDTSSYQFLRSTQEDNHASATVVSGEKMETGFNSGTSPVDERPRRKIQLVRPTTCHDLHGIAPAAAPRGKDNESQLDPDSVPWVVTIKNS